MLHDIKLYNWKGLKSAILNNLGRLNVICGKNNSGKSTLLECFTKEGNRAVGKTLTISDVDGIFNETVNDGTWGDSRTMRASYKSYLEEHLLDIFIFADDVEGCVRNIADARGRRFNDYRFPAQHIAQRLNEHLQWKDRCVLVPAKRVIELKAKVQADQPIENSGAGVLNYLFRAKNQERQSEDRKAYDEIQAAFESISGGYRFDMFLHKQNHVELKFSESGGEWIPADACGLGMQDLLILLYWCIASVDNVILIEEPESHMHPDIQRKLIVYLREKNAKQFIFTTHSNVFLSTGLADAVFFAEFKDSVVVSNATSRAALLHSLGYSVADNLVSDLVVLVEGPTDRPIIEEFLRKIGLTANYNIKIWPMGGDIMSQLDLSVFTESYKVTALIDKDPGSRKVRAKFVNKCNDLKIPVYQLKRRSIENYFSLRALKAVFKAQIAEAVHQLDPGRSVEDQIGLNPKGNNGKLAVETTLDEIKDTDMMLFLEMTRKLLKGS